jgi:hypothetical protein
MLTVQARAVIRLNNQGQMIIHLQIRGPEGNRPYGYAQDFVGKKNRKALQTIVDVFNGGPLIQSLASHELTYRRVQLDIDEGSSYVSVRPALRNKDMTIYCVMKVPHERHQLIGYVKMLEGVEDQEEGKPTNFSGWFVPAYDDNDDEEQEDWEEGGTTW